MAVKPHVLFVDGDRMSGVERRASIPPAAPSSPIRRKILIADGSPAFRQELVDVLRQDWHDVIVAGSGEEALALLSVEPVDTVILDWNLRGTDGLDVCRRIRRLPKAWGVQVLLMGGRDDEASKRDALAAGADELLVKSPLLKMRLRASLRAGRADSDALPHSGKNAQAPASLKRSP